jgi:hypothetical protein
MDYLNLTIQCNHGRVGELELCSKLTQRQTHPCRARTLHIDCEVVRVTTRYQPFQRIGISVYDNRVLLLRRAGTGNPTRPDRADEANLLIQRIHFSSMTVRKRAVAPQESDQGWMCCMLASSMNLSLIVLSVGKDSWCNAHRHELLKQQFARVRDVDL